MTLPPVEKIAVWGPQGFLGWSCACTFTDRWLEANRPTLYGQMDGYGRALVQGINVLREDPSIKHWENDGHTFRWFKTFDPEHDEEPDQHSRKVGF